MTKPRILIVDDHRVIAEALVKLLAERFEIADTIDDGRTVCAAVSRLRPDLVLLDLSMRVVNGIEALRQLRERGAAARVIVLTMHADASLAVEALRAGASGYVLKESSGEELVNAIDQVLGGRTYLPPTLTKDILTSMVTGGEPRLELTPQQREVLRLIVTGLRAKEVAAALDIPTRKVEAIKYRMMQSLGVHSTAELVRYALQHHLVA
jgi:DNA-binding NarL/FixJ family response regulator